MAGVSAVRIKDWIKEQLEEKVAAHDICAAMIKSGYSGEESIALLGSVGDSLSESKGLNEPGTGLLEWVEYKKAIGQGEKIADDMVSAGYSRAFTNRLLSGMADGSIKKQVNPWTGPLLFSEDIDPVSCGRLWGRMHELDQRNWVVMGGRKVRIAAKKPAQGIFMVDGFLSDDECETLIRANRDRVEESMVVDANTGLSRLDSVRTSRGASHTRGETKEIRVIEERLSSLVGLGTDHQEGIHVLEYQEGREYKPHHDYFSPDWMGHREITSNGGQRICTVLMYLSDVEAGGETIFPLIGLGFSPKKGCALLFANADHNGLLMEWSQHGGNPVIAGEKWVATMWFRSGLFVT